MHKNSRTYKLSHQPAPLHLHVKKKLLEKEIGQKKFFSITHIFWRDKILIGSNKIVLILFSVLFIY